MGKNKNIRNAVIFIALFLFCLVGPSVFRHFSDGLFTEFRAPVEVVSSHLSDLQKFWSLHSHSKRDLIEAGRDLARLNASYEIKLQENDALKNQLSRYEALLRLPSYQKYKLVVARVVLRDLNAWWQHIVVRRGSMDGIKEGYAVIYAGGIVGRVVQVSLYTSVVELASSRNFRLAAHFEGDDSPVIYQGAGSLSFHDPRGKVTDVPSNIHASTNSPRRLVTSSLAGSFPDNLFIGDVFDLKLDNSAIFKEGYVKLSNALSTLREVVILAPIEDSIETKTP